MLKKLLQSALIGLCTAAVVLALLPLLQGNRNLFSRQNDDLQVVSYASAVRIASPAVVNVYNQSLQASSLDRGLSDNGLSNNEVRVNNLGSGVIMRADGYILTNRHVISNADQIVVALQNGQIYQAGLVGSDSLTDLAVLKIQAENLPTIPQNKQRRVSVGDVALAIGNPYNLGQSVSQGIISATGRSALGEIGRQNFIQTDASINRGNSGGALINTAGELIGINTLSIGKDSSEIAEGLSFAIPINIVNDVLKKIIQDGRVIRGYFGVESQIFYNNEDQLGLNQRGVLVTAVAPNGPAYQAGILQGDLIVRFNGKAVNSPTDLLQIISDTRPGTVVEVQVERLGQLLNLPVTIAEYPTMG
ncbi:outer membrane-stress sensor serine endopeptidase DegS [Testudinibacter sp. TR-2022]|uniref:outer membrane-stress sensor serine endopeptidase DegS n=1 Tax=Testudinibacter sp. TR-2022 TaxID=2585029 RepID=UPI001118535A|nr:outer membrane-stress sensor serine endopeptidase DegS [Testudinibacter sp. TR-2022]TNH06737.1 outer membrane-stress sensor serine endopeptidase DegS [Pasteurellaceae bacterium Phil11]TNH20580.1 outer membrane-stress sensor serine endopeptidase DegS [Testudinibacter sp. TR-2022]TNH26059.1 outer membrane-stress sensor serine endopeptidase DegS [Testudinibacter sp. TR-2022]